MIGAQYVEKRIQGIKWELGYERLKIFFGCLSYLCYITRANVKRMKGNYSDLL